MAPIKLHNLQEMSTIPMPTKLTRGPVLDGGKHGRQRRFSALGERNHGSVGAALGFVRVFGWRLG